MPNFFRAVLMISSVVESLVTVMFLCPDPDTLKYSKYRYYMPHLVITLV